MMIKLFEVEEQVSMVSAQDFVFMFKDFQWIVSVYLLIHFLGTYKGTPKFSQMELRTIVIHDLLAASFYPQLPYLKNS